MNNSKHQVVLNAINKFIATKELREINSSDLYAIIGITSAGGIDSGIKMLQQYSKTIVEEKLRCVPFSTPNSFYSFVQSECQDWYIKERHMLSQEDAQDIIKFLVVNDMCGDVAGAALALARRLATA